MAKSAWKAYKQFALGKEALAPLTNSSIGGDTGKSVIAALGTLKVMGLDEEFNEGRQWLASGNNWKFESLPNQAFFDEVSEYLGGLLSAYALSGEQVFLDKATEIVDAIGPVYKTSTGLPMERFDPKTKTAEFTSPPLSTVGGTFLEFIYYAKVANKPDVKRRVHQIRNYLKAHRSGQGLYGVSVDVNAKANEDPFQSTYRGVDWNTNDFYRALLLSAIQNTSDTEGLQMYKEAMEALIETKYIYQNNQGTVIIHYTNSKQYLAHEFNNYYYNCHLGGLMALGAQTLKKTNNNSVGTANRQQQLGVQIAEDCHEASKRTVTKLGPLQYMAQTYLPSHTKHYRLTPDFAETNFVLWRLTGDTKYRERSWEMVQAIKRHAKTASGGFAEISDVTREGSQGNRQPPIFLSGTLKFLYLTFSGPETLPLNQWVFNSVGHAFPVLTN